MDYVNADNGAVMPLVGDPPHVSGAASSVPMFFGRMIQQANSAVILQEDDVGGLDETSQSHGRKQGRSAHRSNRLRSDTWCWSRSVWIDWQHGHP